MHFLVVTSSASTARRERLRRSIAAAHPDAQIVDLLCDARPPSPTASAISLAQDDLDGFRWADLVVALGERAAGWAAAPWAVQRFGDARPLVVIDDGLVVIGSLDRLVAPGHTDVVARARRVEPDTGLAWGGLQPGLVAFRGPAATDLEWWRSRAVEAATAPEDAGRSGRDGPWWAAREGVELLTEPALRLAPDVAELLDVTVDDGRYTIDDEPLALIDLGDVDPRSPWWFARSGDRPRHLTSRSDGLRHLCDAMARDLTGLGWTDTEPPPSALPGLRLTPAIRRWYRALLADRTGDGPPNPYVAGEVADFVALLAGPGRNDGSGVSRHADMVLDERPDVRGAFPHHRWRDRPGLLQWMWSSGLEEGETSLLTLPSPPSPRSVVRVVEARRPFGVNLAGYLGADLGLGVAARQMRRALEAAGVPTSTVNYDRTSSNQWGAAPGSADRRYHFNLMVIVPDQLPLFIDDVGADFLDGHHNIGLWYWECDTLTQRQRDAFELVDEVWAPTTYLRDVFERAGRRPVVHVPSPLVFDRRVDRDASRDRLGLDDRFTFLFSFDFLSVAARKNPAGLVDAYRRAFPSPDGTTRLILKSINGSVFPRERELLRDTIAGRDDIELWDRLLPGADRLALMAASDCYVSLHRSEGLGLTMAEAMAVGTPVIATGYSGNLDFMDDDSALLVPATEVLVGPGNYYPPTGHWADPDLDVAAGFMRSVRADAALRSSLSEGGRVALEPFSYESVGSDALARLLDVWNGAGARGAA